MHILIIPSEQYVPKESPLSGIFQQDQAHALSRAGYKVGIISPQLRSLPMFRKRLTGWKYGIEVENDNGIPVYRYHNWIWLPLIPQADILFWVNAGMRLFDQYVIEHGMPDIIHAHNALCAGILANRIKEKFKISYVLTEHSSAFARGLIPQSAFSKINNAFNNASELVVVSPNLGKLLKSKFSGSVRTWKWVPNILDRRFINHIPFIKKYNENKDKNNIFKFLNVANLDDNKGHADLLRAFAIKFRNKINVELRIGGDGPNRYKLEMLAKELGITKNVIFLGRLNRNQVLNEMEKCDTFVLSSHYETFGVVLIEALACGKPVVSTTCGGPECIVNMNNGLLVPPKDINALGIAMYNMYKKNNIYNNIDIRNDCISQFGEQSIVEKLSEIYSQFV